jgi:hypothetical protein
LWDIEAIAKLLVVVKVVTSKGSQFATVTTAGSYLSSSDKSVHFGLAVKTVAQNIEIRWHSGVCSDAQECARRPYLAGG